MSPQRCLRRGLFALRNRGIGNTVSLDVRPIILLNHYSQNIQMMLLVLSPTFHERRMVRNHVYTVLVRSLNCRTDGKSGCVQLAEISE